jgi:hypothetical protein
MANPTKDTTITIRATTAIKKLAEKCATAERRSIANYLAYLVEEAAKRRKLT